MNPKQYDIAALGELLIDFTDSGISGQGNPLFEANPGGAPCNVLAMAARLGRKTAFLGKVGEDMFGSLLRKALEEAGIDSQSLRTDPTANTTLAFVRTAPDGDREFSFFRNPGADTRLAPGELDRGILESTRIFHFGSLSLTHEPAREATRQAAALAREAGALVSYDPNLRPLLWGDLAEARAQMLWGASQCRVMKAAAEELEFLTGEKGIPAGKKALLEQCPNIQLLLVTRGAKGSLAFRGELWAEEPAATGIRAIDTTGAGDTFMGCCLSFLLDHPVEGLTEGDLHEMLGFANAAAGLVTTRKGTLRSMPTLEEIGGRVAPAGEQFTPA